MRGNVMGRRVHAVVGRRDGKHKLLLVQYAQVSNYQADFGDYMTKRITDEQIIKEYGNWAVTKDGLEFLPYDSFFIAKDRLDEDWETFMEPKKEEIQLGFAEALEFAREYHSTAIDAPDNIN
jgi:hypothetical protein